MIFQHNLAYLARASPLTNSAELSSIPQVALRTSAFAVTLLQSEDTVFSTIQAMSQDQTKLSNSIDQYQQAAVELKAELMKAFHKLRNRTGKELWKSLNSLQSKDDIPKLDVVLKDVHENIKRLRAFYPEEKSKRLWDKFKRAINKFVKYTLPALTNFMVTTKDLQTVSEYR